MIIVHYYDILILVGGRGQDDRSMAYCNSLDSIVYLPFQK